MQPGLTLRRAILLICLILPWTACDTSATEDTTTDDGQPSDSASSATARTDAYFIADTVRMAKPDEACDLDGDGENDNAVVAMLNSIPSQFMTQTPNQTLADAIADGTLLMVVGVHGIESFAADDSATLKLYGGKLTDPDTGVPVNLFSGEGTIGVVEPAYSSINGSFSGGTLTVSSIDKVGINVPVGDTVVLTEIEQPQAFASVNPYPDSEMLHGKVPQGKICGTVLAKTLVDIATASPKIPDGLRPLLSGIINNAADMNCGGQKCLSISVIFSAVSVSRAD